MIDKRRGMGQDPEKPPLSSMINSDILNSFKESLKNIFTKEKKYLPSDIEKLLPRIIRIHKIKNGNPI